LYYLDLSSFNGALYDYPSPSPQSVIITYPLNYLKGIEYIKLFQTGFNKTDNPLINEPNIFIYNLSMKFVEIKDLSLYPYYLYIATPFGIDISENP